MGWALAAWAINIRTEALQEIQIAPVDLTPVAKQCTHAYGDDVIRKEGIVGMDEESLPGRQPRTSPRGVVPDRHAGFRWCQGQARRENDSLTRAGFDTSGQSSVLTVAQGEAVCPALSSVGVNTC